MPAPKRRRPKQDELSSYFIKHPPETYAELMAVLDQTQLIIRPEWFLNQKLLQDIWDRDPVFAEEWDIPTVLEMRYWIKQWGKDSTLNAMRLSENMPILQYRFDLGHSDTPYSPPSDTTYTPAVTTRTPSYDADSEFDSGLGFGDYGQGRQNWYYPQYKRETEEDIKQMQERQERWRRDWEEREKERKKNYYTKEEVEPYLKHITFPEFPPHLQEFIENEFKPQFDNYPGLREYVESMYLDFVPQKAAPQQLAEYFKDENRVEWYSGWEWSVGNLGRAEYPTPESIRQYFIKRYINYTISHEVAHSIQNFLKGRDPAVAPYPDEEHPEYREFGEKYRKDPGEKHARDTAEKYKDWLLKNPQYIPPTISSLKLAWDVEQEIPRVGDWVQVIATAEDLARINISRSYSTLHVIGHVFRVEGIEDFFNQWNTPFPGPEQRVIHAGFYYPVLEWQKYLKIVPEPTQASFQIQAWDTTPEPYYKRVEDEYGVAYQDKRGRLHNTQGPAWIEPDGTKYWAIAGKWHREDGPAMEHPDGSWAWYQHGKLHRIDGPAVELHTSEDFETGEPTEDTVEHEWWLNDREYSEQEWNLRRHHFTASKLAWETTQVTFEEGDKVHLNSEADAEEVYLYLTQYLPPDHFDMEREDYKVLLNYVLSHTGRVIKHERDGRYIVMWEGALSRALGIDTHWNAQVYVPGEALDPA